MVNAATMNNSIIPLSGQVSATNSLFLKRKLEEVEDKQGVLGNIWNGIKEFSNLGTSMSDCESMLDKYNKGEISFDEALECINEFDSKQKTMSGLLSNIITGVGAIAVATTAAASGPIGWGLAFLKGAPIGAAIKTGLGVLDRATNDIENDEFEGKTLVKDAVSGAITGAASAISSASSVTYKALVNNGMLKTGTLTADIAKGALCGVECGAMSGSTSYLTEVALGDEDFSFEELANNTLTSAFVSGTVGGIVGASTHAINVSKASNISNTSNASDVTNVSKGNGKQIAIDSFWSSMRKVLGTGEREILGL
ncbi:hypothetical protein IJX73_03495 [bacterium]|nr:hypothetical protein [bacterium]